MRPLSASARGIGLRAELVEALCNQPRRADFDFLEIAPENWMGLGGRKRDQLDRIATLYPLVAHGLSLSVGDTQPLNTEYLCDLRHFLDEYGIMLHSDHLSLSRDGTGYLYDCCPYRAGRTIWTIWRRASTRCSRQPGVVWCWKTSRPIMTFPGKCPRVRSSPRWRSARAAASCST
jgi:uncharacterized protein (UPF0276 family)